VIKKLLLSAIFLIFQACLAFGQVSLTGIDLEYGSYRAGFHHYETTDNTRTYKRIFDWNNQTISRPISVSVWYPSTGSQPLIEPMTIVNYLEILKAEEEWEHLPNEQILNWFSYQNTAENRVHLNKPAKAVLDAQPAPGRFPIIIYAPGQEGSSIENFALCEYLASHGYLVISSSSRGADARSFRGTPEKNMEAQARDIEFLIKEAMTLENGDSHNIATMGHSFGGLSNILAQMRNSNIKAVVSLDGSIRYNYATLQRSPFAAVEKVTVPFIHMAQKDIPERVLLEEGIDPALNHQFAFYDELKYSDAYSLKFHDLTHSYFTTLGVLFQTRDLRQDKSDREIMRSYKVMTAYTLHFLDAYLRNKNESQIFLRAQPVVNGIHDNLVSVKYKNKAEISFSFQDFNELAARQQYQNLTGLYRSLVEEKPQLTLPEGQLNNLGLQLLYKPETSVHGINILTLATQLYPESANLFDSLAEAYLYVGEESKAARSFTQSLTLNPQNENAVEKLKALCLKTTQCATPL